MPENLTVERVSERNSDDLMAMLEGLALYHGSEAPPADKVDRLRAALSSTPPRFEAYLALVNGVTAGCVTLEKRYTTYEAHNVLFMGDLYVDEAHRRSGIGEVLLDFARQRAPELDCQVIEWNAVTENTLARNFYAKQGAREWGNILTWYRITL